MAGGLPQVGLADVRGVDDLVAGLVVLLAPVLLDRHAHASAARQPVREAGTDLVVDREEGELLAEDAVVALLRLLHAREVGVDLRLVLADDAVHALEHLVVLVAAVVAAGHLHELHGADLGGMLHVRPAAHLGVVADGVGGDRLAGRLDVRQALELVLLASEHLLRLLGGDVLLDERLVERDEAGDLGLDLREVVGGETVLKVEIVVEPLVRGGADVHLNVVKEVHDRTRGQVRGGVPPHLVSDVHFYSPCKRAYMIPLFSAENKQKTLAERIRPVRRTTWRRRGCPASRGHGGRRRSCP